MIKRDSYDPLGLVVLQITMVPLNIFFLWNHSGDVGHQTGQKSFNIWVWVGILIGNLLEFWWEFWSRFFSFQLWRSLFHIKSTLPSFQIFSDASLIEQCDFTSFFGLFDFGLLNLCFRSWIDAVNFTSICIELFIVIINDFFGLFLSCLLNLFS